MEEDNIGFVEQSGLLVFPVLMEDEEVHTEANDYHCDDLSCPCHDEDANLDN